jgi:carboxyl-terminal processing protease
MFVSRFKKGVPALLAILFACLIFACGVYIGFENRPSVNKVMSLLNKETLPEIQIDFEPFWKTWSVLNEKFVSATSTSEQAKVWGAIQGLTSSLGDPYTVFLPPEDSKLFEEDISGNFEGVGMEIGIRDGALTVVAPLKDSPAYRAGILPGDKIIKIDNLPSVELSVEKAVKLIRGKGGTVVKLTIARNGKESFVITITREPIVIPSIETQTLDGVFIIRLSSFSGLTPNLFRNALRDFILSGSEKLLIDLRGNPGGYLEVAVDVASWFLPVGKVIVRENFGGQADEVIYRSKGYDIFTDKLKCVVLVDGGSASASEILAGALKEHGKATIIGSKTFGKGSVQELVKITPEASLKVTIARWLTPLGTSISEGGLKPNIEIEAKPEDLKVGKDRALERAIMFLTNNN